MSLIVTNYFGNNVDTIYFLRCISFSNLSGFEEESYLFFFFSLIISRRVVLIKLYLDEDRSSFERFINKGKIDREDIATKRLLSYTG